MRRGIAILLVLGCNNGGEERLEAEKRLGEIGRSAENVFYSFIDLVSGALGFTAKSEMNKSDVGKHFGGIGAQLGKVSEQLEAVAVKAEEDGNKDASSKNPVRIAVEAAKTTLYALKGHLESLKDIGDNSKVGEIGSSTKNGVAVNEGALKKVYDALKGIVELAKKEEVKAPEKSDVTVAAAKIGGTTPEHGAKVLAAGANADSAAGPGATTIVSAVSGEEILAAIVESAEGDASGSTGSASAKTSALKFARGDSSASNLAQASALAGAVSGGIALRSLVKEGKLAAQNSGNDDKAVQSAGITAVNKLLGAVEDIIKKTVKNVLGKARVEIDKARSSKTTVQ